MVESLGSVTGETPPSVEELKEKAAWLSRGTFDASETGGNVATAISVEQKDGKWVIPLRGGIDVVDATDLSFLEASNPTTRVVETDEANNALETPEIEVAYTGLDDELRTSFVDLDNAHFVPNEQ